MLILGIETSCDETSAAVVRDGREVLSCVTRTQTEHAKHGGVVPEIASRCHTELLPGIVRDAVEQSGVGWENVDAVAATRGPGLASSLLVGWNMARGIAMRLDKPLVAINHTEAHIHSVFLNPDAPDPLEAVPMLALVVSGGHTSFFMIPEYGDIRLVGRTVDDAAGEALDKAAKMLGLGYPGGPIIDKMSRGSVPNKRVFPEGRVRPQAETGGLDNELCVSFSGLKTALLHYLEKGGDVSPKCPAVSGKPPHPDNTAQTACDYQEAVVDALTKRCERVIRQNPGVKYLACGGGVSLNSRLRARLAELCESSNLRLLLALPKHCGDNAAMIAGLARMGRGIRPPESNNLDVLPNWAIQ